MPNYQGGLGYGNRSFVGQADGGLRSQIFSGGRGLGGDSMQGAMPGSGLGAGIGFELPVESAAGKPAGGLPAPLVGNMMMDGAAGVPDGLGALLAALGGGAVPAGGEQLLAQLLASGQVPMGVGLEELGLEPRGLAAGSDVRGGNGNGEMILGALVEALSDPAVWRSMLGKLR